MDIIENAKIYKERFNEIERDLKERLVNLLTDYVFFNGGEPIFVGATEFETDEEGRDEFKFVRLVCKNGVAAEYRNQEGYVWTKYLTNIDIEELLHIATVLR